MGVRIYKEFSENILSQGGGRGRGLMLLQDLCSTGKQGEFKNRLLFLSTNSLTTVQKKCCLLKNDNNIFKDKLNSISRMLE